MINEPKDYEEPEFDKASKVHDWKNYASDKLIAQWSFFQCKSGE